MRMTRFFVLIVGLLSLVACAVKLPVTNQYQLSAFSTNTKNTAPKSLTLFVSAPDAVAGYQTAQMRYIKKLYQIESFANNAWVSAPADMIYPLLVQSLQRSGIFAVVTTGSYSESDYRLDTQLLALQQNFITKPSVLEFRAKVVLTRVSGSEVVSSRLINFSVPCQEDTPYGGVVAANAAASRFTASVVNFVHKSLGSKKHSSNSKKIVQ